MLSMFIPEAPTLEPAFSGVTGDLAPLQILTGEIELRCTHFSVWMSQVWRLALCAVVNIDGRQFVR